MDFGIEIEFLVPGARDLVRAIAKGVARDLTEGGLTTSFEGYTHRRTDIWKIVTDASLSAPTGYVGLELVSPPLTDPRINDIELACQLLTEQLHAKTNRSCGLHVHIAAHAMDTASMKRLAFLYMENEDIIDGLLPISRRGNGNQYIRSLKANANVARLESAVTVQEIAAAILVDPMSSTGGGSRYVKLNFTSHWRHGTVEFRQHSGTVDAQKIIRWVHFCNKLVEVAQMRTDIGTPPRAMIDSVLAQKLRRARKSALIYQLAARPEGVTAAEMQDALNSTSAPSPAIPLERLGVPYRRDGRRDGHTVYKLLPGSMEPATLASLLDKLGLGDEHNNFWHARAALLGSAVNAVNEEGNAPGMPGAAE